jgi:HK97 family phage major capsid protein
MKIEELKALISDTVKEAVNTEIEPMKETQRKYENIFVQKSKEPEVEEKQDTGITVARIAKCIALAKNDPDKALFYAAGSATNQAKGMYPNDKKVHASLKAMSVSTPSAGGFLVQEGYADDFIPLLTSKTAIMELGARKVPMPNGNINLPRVTGGSTAYYQGENANATASQETLGNVHLSSKKLTILVPISNDLIKNASYAADVLVRDDMMNQAKLKIDYTGMFGDGTVFTPMGIKKAIVTANHTTATGVTTLDADVPGAMVARLMELNIPMTSPGWIFNSQIWKVCYNMKTTTNQYIYRDEMKTGRLEGIPFRVSNQITTANSTAGATYFDIFLGDFSEFIFGEEMSFEIKASDEASYYDGSNTVSSFSLDQTVLKITSKHDMALRHAESFLCWNYPNA